MQEQQSHIFILLLLSDVDCRDQTFFHALIFIRSRGRNWMKSYVWSPLLHKNWKPFLHFALFLALICFPYRSQFPPIMLVPRLINILWWQLIALKVAQTCWNKEDHVADKNIDTVVGFYDIWGIFLSWGWSFHQVEKNGFIRWPRYEIFFAQQRVNFLVNILKLIMHKNRAVRYQQPCINRRKIVY